MCAAVPHRLPPPSKPVHRGLLFRSELVEVRDNACSRHDRGISATTAPMPYHEIVFARSGLWCRHRGRRALPVDSRHVHFFSKESIKNNYIGMKVFFQHATLGRIKGTVIDQDETGYSISSHGVIWNVSPNQQLEIVSSGRSPKSKYDIRK